MTSKASSTSDFVHVVPQLAQFLHSDEWNTNVDVEHLLHDSVVPYYQQPAPAFFPMAQASESMNAQTPVIYTPGVPDTMELPEDPVDTLDDLPSVPQPVAKKQDSVSRLPHKPHKRSRKVQTVNTMARPNLVTEKKAVKRGKMISRRNSHLFRNESMKTMEKQLEKEIRRLSQEGTNTGLPYLVEEEEVVDGRGHLLNRQNAGLFRTPDLDLIENELNSEMERLTTQLDTTPRTSLQSLLFLLSLLILTLALPPINIAVIVKAVGQTFAYHTNDYLELNNINGNWRAQRFPDLAKEFDYMLEQGSYRDVHPNDVSSKYCADEECMHTRDAMISPTFEGARPLL